MPTPRDLRPGRPRLGVLPGFLVVLSPLSQLGFTPVSVVMGAELGWSVGQTGLAVGIYAAAASVATVVLGPVFDLVSPRRVLPVAVAANVVLSASLLLEPGLLGVLTARVLSGFTNSALALCAAVVVSDANRGDAVARERGFSRLQVFTSAGAVVGLGVGATAAGLGAPQVWSGLGAPQVWSWVVVGYGLVVLALAPSIARRMPAAVVRAPGGGTTRLLGDVRDALRTPRTAFVLAAAAGVGWAIQAAHYAVSLLSQELAPPLGQRILLAVMIPAGVSLGASVNQAVLGRTGALRLFTRTYPALPAACVVLAVVVGLEGPVAVAVLLLTLVGLGTVLGVLMPLNPALLVGWHPDLRGSVAAADAVAKGVGSTVSPVVLAGVAAATSLGGGFLVLAVVAAAATLAARAAREPRPPA